MTRIHTYELATTWTGDRGRGTADYRAYDRLYDTISTGRPPMHGSSDPAFRGDPAHGSMSEDDSGGGRFTDVLVRPVHPRPGPARPVPVA